MDYSLYEIVSLFFIYSFLGWCAEEVYATWEYKKFINRGFLNGALCPIYGCGMILVIFCLEPLKNNIIILYIGSVLLTTLIELVTGYALEKIFNEKWWDYSDDKFNFKGYICLGFSLMWGVGCAFIVKVIHPGVVYVIRSIPIKLGITIVSVIGLVFVLDLIVTGITISKFKKKLRLMDELAQKIKAVSNEIGINIYDGVTTAINTEESIKENLEDFKDKVTYAKDVSVEKLIKVKDISIDKLQYAKEMPLRGKSTLQKKNVHKRLSDKDSKKVHELDTMIKKYKQNFETKGFSYSRIVNAFPKLQGGKYKEYLSRMKKIYKK